MTDVTCPRCQTQQSIQGDGYLCAGCAAEWAFVRCASCDTAFHMQPGVQSWTCPNCGTHNRQPRRTPSFPAWQILLGAAALVVVIVAAFIVFSGDGDEGQPGGNGGGSDTALATTCGHIREDFQVIRQQSLQQAANRLTADAEALRAEGDEETAALVDQLAAAAEDMSAVIGSGEDDTAANQALGSAIAAVPCSGV
ncbi:MAG: hypothetical protein ACXWXS_06505 [Actinomycetota bacterium]